MLDLNKLVPQIREMTRGERPTGSDPQRLDAAREQLARAASDLTWRNALPGLGEEPRMALPAEEPLDLVEAAPPRPVPLSVVAVDGSQIAPDPHEVALCCLINVGSVCFRYGVSPHAGEASFASAPLLIYRREELDTLADGAADISFGLAAMGDLDARRMIAESEALAALMRDASRTMEKGDEAALALMDGPLIAWPLGWLSPRALRQEALGRFQEALEVGLSLRFPVAGYISRTRSVDLIQMLRFTLCESARTTGRFCRKCKATLDARARPGSAPVAVPDLPCFAAIDGLIDIDLMGLLLKKGERSAVFASNNRVLCDFDERHRRIGFFFIHTGLEVARVEVPEWVWRDPERLRQLHAALHDQIRLGMGYPIALSEAHEQAVVRAPERQAFFELLRRTLQRDRLPVVTSAKAMRKRGPIA